MIFAIDVGEGVVPVTAPEIGIKDEIVSGKTTFAFVASVDVFVLGSECTVGD